MFASTRGRTSSSPASTSVTSGFDDSDFNLEFQLLGPPSSGSGKKKRKKRKPQRQTTEQPPDGEADPTAGNSSQGQSVFAGVRAAQPSVSVPEPECASPTHVHKIPRPRSFAQRVHCVPNLPQVYPASDARFSVARQRHQLKQVHKQQLLLQQKRLLEQQHSPPQHPHQTSAVQGTPEKKKSQRELQLQRKQRRQQQQLELEAKKAQRQEQERQRLLQQRYNRMKTLTTNVLIREVTRYDGQTIWTDDADVVYQVGSYLGGGAAGVVYEGLNSSTNANIAVKILNPIGFKLTPAGVLHRYLVALQGEPVQVQQGDKRTALSLEPRHIWWLVHPSSREVLAAFLDPRFSKLREVPLTQCVQLWGWDADIKPPPRTAPPLVVKVRGSDVAIPTVPKKFVRFLTERRSIFREIASMSKIRGHPNCLKLEDVLELLNDSKSTIFLVLELALGGELFDRIEIDRGTSEPTARHYFAQLLEGLFHCHSKGVCHRDLKPENLLLADNEDDPTLKIADFGLSALFRERELSKEEEAALAHPPLSVAGGGTPTPTHSAGASNLVRLKSIVGSPHYVAPEILNGNSVGYEGAKADVWSAGVILYAMLAGNLPFGKEILKCPRFNKWKAWTQFRRFRAKGGVVGGEEFVKPETFPTWFFPHHFSEDAIDVLTCLLEPDAELRISVAEALRHPWVDPSGIRAKQYQAQQNGQAENRPTSLSLDDPAVTATVSTSHPSSPCVDGPPMAATILEGYESMDSCKSSSLDGQDAAATQEDTRLEWTTSASSAHSGISQLSIDATFQLNETSTQQSPTAEDNHASSMVGETEYDATGLAPQLSTLSLAGNTSGIGGGANRLQRDAVTAHMPFNSPPLAPRSVREMNAAHGDNTGAGMKRVSSLDDFALDGDRAWMPEEQDAGFSSTPQHNHTPTQVRRRQQTSVTQSPVLSFISANGARQRAIDTAQLNDLQKFLEQSDDLFFPSLPVFNDLVQRSTRFSTNVPAGEVILRIADIVARDEYPLPEPYTHIRQKVQINREEYRLEVTRGGILICTVQVYQLRAGMYMADFTRGQYGIFAFKRFFEDIRRKLQQKIKVDYSRTSRLLDTPTIDGKSLLQATKLKRTVSNQF